MIEPLRILIVDDSPEDRTTYKRLLLRANQNEYVFSEVDNGEDALNSLKDERPDCILLDYNLPELDGLEFLVELNKQNNNHIPAIVMLTGEGNEGIAVQAMKNGVQDYLIKAGITGEDLRRAINNAIEKTELKHLLKMREDELKRLAVTDDLTGLYSRRYTMDHLNEEIYRAQRYDTPFCLALIDLDHFKQVNDHHGHLVGDQVLKGFSKILETCTRQLDIVGRYGGEEFLIILPSTTLDQAQQVGQRIRTKACIQKYASNKEKKFHVTCSIGLTEYDIGVIDTDVMIQRTDEALYQAKDEGRNRLCIWADHSAHDTTPNHAYS